MSALTRLLSALLLPAMAAAATAQQPIPAASPALGKIVLDVVVAPRSGSPVAGLTKQDFTLLDNNVAQPIAGFQPFSGSSEPIEVVLLVDAVNTSTTNLSYEREEIDKFLRANNGRLAHPTSLAIFTDTATQIAQGFSTDGNAISASLDRQTIGLREIRRSAGFWGADDRIQLSLNALQMLAAKEASHPGRKIILWVSPGWPYLSGPGVDLSDKDRQRIYSTVTQISTSLRQHNITLYSVDSLNAQENIGREFEYEAFLKGINRPVQAELADLSLQVLAIQSGGLALGASNDISGRIEQCVEDLGNYYEISFVPPPPEHPGEYHRIDIKLDRPGLAAHTRSGYYAQP